MNDPDEPIPYVLTEQAWEEYEFPTKALERYFETLIPEPPESWTFTTAETGEK